MEGQLLEAGRTKPLGVFGAIEKHTLPAHFVSSFLEIVPIHASNKIMSKLKV